MDPFGFKVIFVIFLVFVPLERLFGMHPQQRIFRRDWRNDVIFLLFNGMLTKLGLLAVIVGTIFCAAWIVPAPLQAMVGGLPYWVQIPAVIVLADLGFYWIHRLFHAVPWLWRFHSVHHSMEELDWLAASRGHPVDQIVTMGGALVPVVALGFSEWAIGVFASLHLWQSVLVHSNVRVGFGPLRFLFVSPEFHHWHHSNQHDARDRNFAAQLSILDVLFGSFHLPKGQIPTSYGLDQPMPQRYVRQLLYPFIGERIFQSRPDTAALAETMRVPEEAPRPDKPRYVTDPPCLTG